MIAACAAITGLIFTSPGPHAADYPWQPDKPVTIIVPWAPGGPIDQVARLVASELNNAFGQTVATVNQPGNGGVVGTRNAWESPRDGYTWVAGSTSYLQGYSVEGLLDASLDEWALFLNLGWPAVLVVRPDAPYRDFQDLLEAMEADPGNVRVAMSPSPLLENVMDAIARQSGVDYEAVRVDYNLALTTTIAGETDLTIQLASRIAEFVLREDLRPLAVVAREPLELAGYGSIPPITDWLPDVSPTIDYVGIWAPKDTPPEVLETMTLIWKDEIATSEALRKYAADRGAFYTPYSGQDAYNLAVGHPTLAGIDSDSDGVRNDVEDYIDSELSDSSRARAAAKQYAAVIQQPLQATPTAIDPLERVRAESRALDCLYALRPDDAYQIAVRVLAKTLNTRERLLASRDTDSLIISESDAPDDVNPCEFDPASFPD